jgi:predicted nucleotide-binding protein
MPDEEPGPPSILGSTFGSPLESLFGSSGPLLYGPAVTPPSKVFIVHGHNDPLMYELSHYLQKARLDVIIFREELKRSQTVPEKLFDLAKQAGFAVALLTADDWGGKWNTASLQPRARQNVVFEMGLFIGMLGRRKVCAVYEPGIEWPSDIQGIQSVKYVKDGTWKHDVAREIDATGIKVDFRRLS